MFKRVFVSFATVILAFCQLSLAQSTDQELEQNLLSNEPVPVYNAYLHLIVALVELDAMVELVGEAEARALLREKVNRLTIEPLSSVDQRYKWYILQVLDYTHEIGKILAKYNLIITPNNGLIVGTHKD